MRSKIPISIAPLYWVTSAVIAYLGSKEAPHMLTAMISWMIVIFISILVHELGHALSAKMFGQAPVIKLIAFGGLTIPGPKKIKKWQEFTVIFCGPLFGFLLFLLAAYITTFNFFAKGSFFAYMLDVFVWVNLFWTVVNLLPIIPLDGGQLVRVVLQGLFKKHGERIALVLSVFFGSAVSVFAFSYFSIFVGIVVLLFVFQNIAHLRQIAFKSVSDENEEVTFLYREGQEKFANGDQEGAKATFIKVREVACSGIIYSLATQVLAKMAFEAQNYPEAFNYLNPLYKQLRGENIKILHEAAFRCKHLDTVKKMARECYKLFPTSSVALINAKAYAAGSEVRHAIGWLKAALDQGLSDSENELKSSYFDSIRDESAFKKLTRP
ncbi:hypothetical protein COB21_02275 [Candidatus Aerophobetes bacterium]|uniref:Peptidase M50 domain-containing protein n=1 Tax=Aerophobetes bacterium TaxID=2030807 RepID=A0A2A4X5G7_UNCAE|nr:MAG: hypothetical protein COB21_02275 [Candidatus Aerophobetes bacterium]